MASGTSITDTNHGNRESQKLRNIRAKYSPERSQVHKPTRPSLMEISPKPMSLKQLAKMSEQQTGKTTPRETLIQDDLTSHYLEDKQTVQNTGLWSTVDHSLMKEKIDQ